MSNAAAQDAAFASAIELEGIRVDVTRGTGTNAPTIALTVIPGRTPSEAHTSRGTIEQRQTSDWIVCIAELASAGLWPPKIGDLFNDGQAEYRVAMPGGVKNAWDPWPGNRYARIHTVQIEPAAP